MVILVGILFLCMITVILYLKKSNLVTEKHSVNTYLSQKGIDWLEEWNTEAEIATSISKIAQKVVEILVNVRGEMSNRTESYAKAETLARQAF